MVEDHLPGGQFWNPTEELKQQTRSVLKHNKLPEFPFGQLDQLLRTRPNAKTLTNERFLMYSFKKTREWLCGLDQEEKDRLLSESRKEGTKIRCLFKERIEIIEKKRLEHQKEKQKELERKEADRIKKAGAFTSDICYYGLFQNLNQLNEGLERLDKESEKRKALESQIKFRKNVLHQKHADKKVFKKLPLDTLKKMYRH